MGYLLYITDQVITWYAAYFKILRNNKTNDQEKRYIIAL